MLYLKFLHLFFFVGCLFVCFQPEFDSLIWKYFEDLYFVVVLFYHIQNKKLTFLDLVVIK